MKTTIRLKNDTEGRIGVQIDNLTEIQEEIHLKNYREVIFDFADIDFLYTTFILGLAVIVSNLKSKGIITTFINKKENISSYFEAICFPHGLMPDKSERWPEILENPSNKTFLPVVNFSNARSEDETVLRNNIISRFGRLLSNKLNFDTSIHTAICYFISEFTDNVVEHSGQERGWLFYQHYPKKEYIEISIMDSGKTILGSYKDYNNKEITNDKEALKKALEGLSTKGVERGYGLRTSSSIVEGLVGTTFLTSGMAMYIKNHEKNAVILSCKNWKGTILAIKVPCKMPPNFNIHDFISQ